MAANKAFGINVLAVSKGLEQVGREVTKLGKTLEDFNRKTAKATLDVETKRAEEKVGQFARDLQAKVERAVRSLPDVKLGADASAVDRRIQEIRRELASIADKRVGVGVDTTAAQARIDRLSTELDRLSRKSPSVQVKADTAAASAQLAGISRQASRIDGQRVAISVNASDVSRAISLVGLLTAGLAGASALVGPAAAGLAALGPLASAGAQGIGAVAAGFSGIGDAVKALSQQETKTAADTAVSAASRINSAQAIASAQRQVQAATISADRAAVTGAQQVEDARRSLANAYEQGSRQVAAASQSLARAQRDERDAQQALNLARADAIEQLQQLGFSVEEADIAQQRATIRLNEARAALAASTDDPNSDAYKTLALDVKDAELAVRETSDRFSDLQKQSAQAAKTGVEGTTGVIAAQRQVADATQGVRDAEAALAQTRSDAAKQVEDAQRQVQRAIQQSSFAQQDAARAIADAQASLANAYADAGNAGSTAANKVKETFSDLSPEAQHFATMLVHEVIPGLKGIRDSVQATLLPRLETSFRNLGQLTPVVRTELSDTGRVLGDLAVKGSEMMSSGPWRRDFSTIMDSNNRVLESFGQAGLSSADAVRHLTAESGPMVERFAALTAKAAQQADTFLTNARATGELDRFFDEMGDELLELVHIAGQIVTAFVQVSQALGPLGGVLLEAVGNVAELIGNFAQAYPTLTQLIGVLVIATSAFSKLGNVVAGVVALRGSIVDGWTKIGNAISALAPASVATRLGWLQRGIEAGGLAAGTATERIAGYVTSSQRAADAGEKVAVVGSKVATVATKVGSALPVLGVAVAGLAIAYDSLTLSAEDGATALLKGGAAAEAAKQQLESQNHTLSNLLLYIPVAGSYLAGLNDKYKILAPTLDDATQKAREQFNAMTPLGQAQVLAAKAANAYGDAVKAHGPASTQAADAAKVLAAATDAVEQEQRQADQAMMSLNERIQHQQDLMLGATNAEIAYRNSLQALTDGITQNGLSFDMNTAAGRNNLSNLTAAIEASGRFRQSLIDQGHSEGFATQKAWEQRDALVASMVQAGMTRDAAQALIDKYMKIPPRIYTKADLDTTEATNRLNSWLASIDGRQVRVVLNAVSPEGRPIRQLMEATGGVVDPMARGGIRTMSNRVAQVVPPNTPRLIGDRISGREYFLPDDNAPRTMAIGSQWAADRGLALVPMADGGRLGASLGATASGDLFKPLTDSAEQLQKAGLQPLAAELTDTTVPALVSLQQSAQTDTPASLTALTKATVDTGRQIQATWTANTVAVTAAQVQQTGQYQTLGANLASATTWMTRSVADLQARHNASWLDMRVRAGAEIGQITGPQFGGLHQGMDLVQGHATNMANWVGGQFGRIRGLTADPIRWSLDFPLNRGLVPAWNAINAFFALNRPMGPVPVAFAHGTEDHRAVIARPGQMRVWNEPETGGEAYIPLAGSKRARSTKILGAVASEFGYALEPRYFADGGLWRQMFGIVKGQFPSATLNSAYRPGDPGYHGSGRATDLGGPMMAIDQWLASRFPNSTELIHTPGINLWHGAPHTYNAATRAEHVNHVHWAMENAAMLGGAPGFYGGSPGGGGFDMLGFLNEKLADTRRMVADIQRFHGAGNLPTALTRLGNDAVQGAIDLALRSYAPTDVPGAGVERWRPTVHLALDLENQPRAFDNITLRRMQQESGGNPRAINLTDINAQRGDPSRGLMQVIGATFNRYWDPRTPKDIWNPLSNIAASMRYAVAHYGSLPTAYNRPGGYDRGGIAAKAGWLWKGTNLPERVLDPRTTVAFERMVDVLNTHRGAPSVIVSAPAARAALGAASGGMDWRAAAPVIRAAFVSSLREVLGEGIKTDVDYDRLTWRLNQVTALNARR